MKKTYIFPNAVVTFRKEGNKMNQNESIKALECCINNKCSNCPLRKMACSETVAMENALGLINRYQAEDDKLRKRLEKQKHTLFEQQAYSAELQAEIARLKKSNRNWRRKVQRLRAEKKIADKEIYEKGLL